MNNGKFFAGLALGALVGSALSCFAHSNRGRKLRRDVYDAIQDLQEDAKDLAHHAKHKAEEVSSEVAGKVGEKVEEVKGKIHEAVNKKKVSFSLEFKTKRLHLPQNKNRFYE